MRHLGAKDGNPNPHKSKRGFTRPPLGALSFSVAKEENQERHELLIEDILLQVSPMGATAPYQAFPIARQTQQVSW